MAINTLAYATLFQKELDKAAERDAVTGWMEANAGQVIYNGGAEVKIPILNTQGLGDYDRDDGYVQGAVVLRYETRAMTQDRGRKFQLDSMDVDETNFVATAGAVMGEFQRTKVVPEIDAYRLSKIANYAIAADNAVIARGGSGTGMVAYGQIISSATSTLRKIKEGIKAIREQGYNGDLVIHANDAVVMELELEIAGKLRSITFAQGGVNTEVPSVDKVPIIETPANRMYSAITLYDGSTDGQKEGGYVKAVSGLDVNFLIMPRLTPLAISKQDKMRIFDPDTYQKADAWALDYRRYHDLWVKENQIASIYASIKDAAPGGATGQS